MRRFWNARAREDAFYFVDTRRAYGSADADDFWNNEDLVDFLLGGLGVTLRDSDTVLEIGCGIGRITRGLAARAGQVVALDVSDEMLARAQRHNPDLERVRWVLGDGSSLPGIAEQSIDACVSVVVFQHIPDPAITLGYVVEVGRVLRDHGWAALQISNDPATHRPRTGLWFWLKSLVGRAPKGQRDPAWLGSHVELSDLRRAAADGGMTVERVWGEGSQYCQVLLRRHQRGPESSPAAATSTHVARSRS
jgi:SAM-dependent methyltransferase